MVKPKINSRAKGAAGEREFIGHLHGWLGDWVKQQVKRNLEQTRAGGHDIVGLGSWAVEVKRYAKATDGDIAKWWDQAVEQAGRVCKTPVLAYREDHREWRVRLPMAHLMRSMGTLAVEWTVEVGMEAFCALVRETIDMDGLIQSVEADHVSQRG